jgi:hypothetical protein
MKCTNCNKEWTTPQNKSLSKCPFCQTLLNTEAILGNMLKAYGNELLQNQLKLSSMISDLFSHDPKIKRLLLLSVRENIPLQLATIKESEISLRITQINTIKHRLVEDAFMNEDAGEQIVALWTTSLGCEIEEPDDSFEIVWQKGYCAFRNSKGKMITPYKYDGAEDFSNNLALVMQNGKFGFINIEGFEQLPFIYTRASSFSDGLAYVEITTFKENYVVQDFGEGYFECDENVSRLYINSNGDVVFDLSDNYSWYPFSEGLARVYNKSFKKYGYINTIGEQTIAFEYEKAGDFKNGIALVAKNAYAISGHDGNFGFINKNGIEFIPTNFEYAKEFNEGLAAIEINGKWGFINKSGKVIIQPKYGRAMSFSDGLAPVYLNRNWGYIDKNDEIIIPFIYDNAKPFKDGVAYVAKNSIYYGLINLKGQVVSEFMYTHLLDFTNGVSLARNNNLEKYGLINEKGKEVSKFKYDWFDTIADTMWGAPQELNFRDGLVCVKMNDKFGFLDYNGDEVIPLIYEEVDDFGVGFALVKLNGNSFSINKNGTILSMQTYNYSNCLIDFNEGFSKVRSKKYGFVDYQWKEITPLKYDEVENFHEGMALVELNGKYGFINKQGREVIPLQYVYATSFNNGLAIVRFADRFGLIDKSGQIVVPMKYNTIQPFKCGLARVKINGKWGFLDSAGNVIIPIIYEAVSDFDENIALALLDGEWGALNLKGEVVIEFQFRYEHKCSEYALIQINSNRKNSLIVAGKYLWKTSMESRSIKD